MTKRKEKHFLYFGQKVVNYRKNLNLIPNSRENFISNRIEMGLLEENDISLKTLTNIENGYTMPTILTLMILGTALEIDIYILINDLIENIQINKVSNQ